MFFNMAPRCSISALHRELLHVLGHGRCFLCDEVWTGVWPVQLIMLYFPALWCLRSFAEGWPGQQIRGNMANFNLERNHMLCFWVTIRITAHYKACTVWRAIYELCGVLVLGRKHLNSDIKGCPDLNPNIVMRYCLHVSISRLVSVSVVQRGCVVSLVWCPEYEGLVALRLTNSNQSKQKWNAWTEQDEQSRRRGSRMKQRWLYESEVQLRKGSLQKVYDNHVG